MARKIIQQKKTENIQNKNGHSVLTHGHINVSDGFDIDNVLHRIKHYLPSQTPLKDFIHHNSLHAFQDKLFYEGIFTAATIFGYQVTLELKDYRQLYSEGRIRKDVVNEIVEKRKGVISADFWKSCMLEKKYDCHLAPRIGWLRSHWNTRLNFDIDNKVQPLLFRILSSYLDQGIAIQKFPLNEKGFLASIRDLQKNSGEGFFKTKRAKDLLLNEDIGVYELLMILVGNESAFEHYLFDQQFSHRGWSGMVATLEAKPDSLLDKRRISLYDVVVLELLLEIDALDFYFKNRWNPLTIGLPINSYNLFAPVQKGEVMEVLSLWQDAFEWSYYDDVLSGLSKGNLIKATDPVGTSFQAMFCIDERECSLRRHIESIDPKCETFGSPGFFGVEFFFKPEHENSLINFAQLQYNPHI